MHHLSSRRGVQFIIWSKQVGNKVNWWWTHFYCAWIPFIKWKVQLQHHSNINKDKIGKYIFTNDHNSTKALPSLDSSCFFLEMIKSGVLPSFSSPTIWEKSSTFYTCIASRRLSLSDQQWTPDEHLDVIKIVRFSSKALWPFYVLWSRSTAGVAKTASSATFQHFCIGIKMRIPWIL